MSSLALFSVVGCLSRNERYQELHFSWILSMKNEFEAACLRVLPPVVMRTQLPCRYQGCNTLFRGPYIKGAGTQLRLLIFFILLF